MAGQTSADQQCLAAVRADHLKLAPDYWCPRHSCRHDCRATNWDAVANWASGSTNSTAITITGANLNADPRCMVEDLGSGSYRVTGRGVGASSDSVVMLQATYSNE